MFIIKPLKIKLQTGDNPIDLFLSNTEVVKNNTRNICFYRVVGSDCNESTYIERIKNIDKTAKDLGYSYLRINSLIEPKPDEIQTFSDIYNKWADLNKSPEDIMKLPFPLDFRDENMNWNSRRAFLNILKLYRESFPSINDSILKSLGVKLLFWIDNYLKPLFSDINQFPKILFMGEPKKHDTMFVFYCSKIGCDILYMNSKEDLNKKIADNHSRLFVLGSLCEKVYQVQVQVPQAKSQGKAQSESISLGHAKKPVNRIGSKPPVNTNNLVEKVSDNDLSYEELAKLSSSVVMIGVFNSQKKCIQTGSGVVISSQGHILTNFHVVAGGEYFSIRYENDNADYLTDNLIKYHNVYDLAIIKVQNHSQPIHIQKEAQLVRGQKIVAIGSPLGLFNSISDGIISGFRVIGNRDMVQFTAPISPGSSGGALLDLRGNLVGLITAHIHEGQNLNLAVDRKLIRDFASSFIK